MKTWLARLWFASLLTGALALLFKIVIQVPLLGVLLLGVAAFVLIVKVTDWAFETVRRSK